MLEQSPQTVQLKVPRGRVTEVCRDILTNCRATDISVQEPPVEEVIRQLFAEEKATGGPVESNSPV